MKPKQALRLLALLMALALPLAALAEEWGEMDLYDPAIYEGNVPVMTEPPEAELPTPPAMEWPQDGGEAAAQTAEEAADAPEAASETPAPEAEDASAEGVPSEADACAHGAWTALDEAALDALDPADRPKGASPRLTLEDFFGEGRHIYLSTIRCDACGAVGFYVSDVDYDVEGEAVFGDSPWQLWTALLDGRFEPQTQLSSGASAVRLDVSSLQLGLKEKYALSVTDASGKAVVGAQFKSASTKIATVDASGVITARKTGTTKVGVKGPDGSVAYCTVKVLKAPSKVTLSDRTRALALNESFRLTFSLPKKSAGRVTFSSGNPDVVAVEADGTVRPVSAGDAVVTATAYNGKKAQCKVKVLDGDAPTFVELDAASLTLGVGEKRALTPSVDFGAATLYAYSTKNKKIARVSADGVVTARKAGATTIAVMTHNGKTALCTVKVLKAPAKVTLSEGKLSLSAGQTWPLTAALSSGSVGAVAWASSNPAVVTVDENGLVTAVADGAATVTVMTYNKKKATCKVVVSGAGQPSQPAAVTGGFDAASASLAQGAKQPLTGWVKVEGGALDGVAVYVDDAAKPALSSTACKGKSAVRLEELFTLDASAAPFKAAGAYTLKLYASVGGKVTGQPLAQMTLTVEAPLPTGQAKMLENLKKDTSLGLGTKKDAIVSVVALLMESGYEPAFAAGVAANVYAEGSYGFFESSKYITYPKKRPRYFCYLDGGEYYKNGVLTTVYLSAAEYKTYKGKAEKQLRYAEENFYRNRYSGKYAWDVNLTQLEALLADLEKGGWVGKFGLGVTQWTGSRTKYLVGFYRKHAGKGNTITKAQVMAAENEAILAELKGAYAFIYSNWKSANGNLKTEAAAGSAGSLICLKYEIPATKETQAVIRSTKAKAIYRVMAGN